ncbi:hypothetical protein Tco_0802229 [Tanacetum coccineum]|uniref:Uncharacterized protein n=1 Tax=Tanacetum coccineum TaxID=301880 RepID=A0ABQ5A0K0_9ASTR
MNPSGKYLEVLLISFNLLYRDGKVLVERLQNRIFDWKNKLLPFAGPVKRSLNVRDITRSGFSIYDSVYDLVANMQLSDALIGAGSDEVGELNGVGGSGSSGFEEKYQEGIVVEMLEKSMKNLEQAKEEDKKLFEEAIENARKLETFKK